MKCSSINTNPLSRGSNRNSAAPAKAPFTSVGLDIKHAKRLSPAINSVFKVFTLNDPAVAECKTAYS